MHVPAVIGALPIAILVYVVGAIVFFLTGSAAVSLVTTLFTWSLAITFTIKKIAGPNK